MVALFNIVYNTVYDIIFRGIDGRKITQTRDSAAAQIRSGTGIAGARTGGHDHRQAH
jgi:hypothetical protein